MINGTKVGISFNRVGIETGVHLESTAQEPPRRESNDQAHVRLLATGILYLFICDYCLKPLLSPPPSRKVYLWYFEGLHSESSC